MLTQTAPSRAADVGEQPGNGQAASENASRFSFFRKMRRSGSRAWMAIVAMALGGFMMSPGVGHAEQSPFAALAGSWFGGGNISLSSGSRERLRCRASYVSRGGGAALDLTLRCASDSYNFSFSGSARYRAGMVTGSWTETTQGVSGQFIGRASAGHISARVQGDNFTASLDISTHGDRQSISIRSPGSEFSEVSVGLRRH